jgi:hypothetical protein
VIGDETGFGEALAYESHDFDFLNFGAIARTLADQPEGLGAYLIDAAAGFEM